jgi:hypothetical protein
MSACLTCGVDGALATQWSAAKGTTSFAYGLTGNLRTLTIL